MKQMEEEEKAQVVRLGDASIAAPFTSRYASIESSWSCVSDCILISMPCHQAGTLVTTLQMFKQVAGR